IRHQHDGRGFDDVAVLHAARAVDGGGVRGYRVGGVFDGPDADDEQPAAIARQRGGDAAQAEDDVELLGGGGIGQTHRKIRGHHHGLAAWRYALAGVDGDGGGAGLVHEQAGYDAGAARASQIGQAREEIVLVADLVFGGQKTAVEVARASTALIDD